MNNRPDILIVDDESANIELLREITGDFCNIYATSNGLEAFEQAQKILPDLILLDVNLPQIDGYEICRQIKQDNELRDIPVIFLSALDATSDKIAGFEAGGLDYITRPFSPSEVSIRIKTYLELRNMQKQYEAQNILLQEEIKRRQQAEAEVRKSEEKYRSLFEKTQDAVFIIGLDLKIKEINQQAATLLRTSPDVIVNRDMSAFIASDEIEDGFKKAKNLLSGESLPVYERKFQRLDGTEFPAELTATLIRDEDGQAVHFHSVVRDISERKQLQLDLEASEQRYREILENASEAVFSTNHQGIFTYVNPVMVQRSGYSEEELIGKHFTELIDETWRERASAFFYRQAIEQIPETVFSFPLKPFNGEQVWVDQTTNLVIEDGTIKGFLGITRDITARKKVEAQREQLIAELDAFAHTVAHDLKTPISSIKLSSQMLHTMYHKMSDEKRQKSAEKINKNVDKMVNIIDELLLLATIRKSEDIPRQQLDMKQIIQDALQRLKLQIKQQGAEYSIADSFPVATGYAPWIEEVLVNYISNALKYGGKPPRIEIGSHPAKDNMICFWVKDNGPGISPDAQEKLLFRPFERLNQVSIEGHGLGLSIVQRIVNKLDGTVGVESEEGKGSKFYFTLPETSL